MELLPDEHVILESDDKTFVLTNYKVEYYSKHFGGSRSVFIFLENVISVQITTKQYFYLLSVGLLFIGYATVLNVGIDIGKSSLESYVGFLIGVTFLALWFITRKKVILISSDAKSSKIELPIKNIDNFILQSVVKRILAAKLERMEKLIL